MKSFIRVIRKMKSALFRNKIESATLEEICEAANPTISSYITFLEEHYPDINPQIIVTCKDLYVKDPSQVYQHLRKCIEPYNNAEVIKLFDDTFSHLSPNATLLVMKHGLENNIIFHEHNNIIIKNIDITGKLSLEFNQFTQVSFIRNVFRDDTIIKIRNSESAQGGFLKNHAGKNLEFNFYNVSHIVVNKNKYMENAVFNYNPHVFGLNYNASHSPTTIVFISNKISNLSINDHLATKEWNRNSTPIKHVAFFNGNKVKHFDIQTTSNKIYDESTGTFSADIESIFFDTYEDIGLSYEEGSPLPGFAEMFFRELKKQAINKDDHLLENTYKRQEKIFLRTRLYRLEDKLILWWGDFASNTGTSWKKPLGLLFSAQFILALTAYCLFAGYDPYLDKMCAPDLNIMCTSNLDKTCTPEFNKTRVSDLEECNPHLDTGFTPFLGLLAWFMNPVSLLPSAKITMASWTIYALFFCQKLFSAVFYYELVKVLRRFSK